MSQLSDWHQCSCSCYFGDWNSLFFISKIAMGDIHLFAWFWWRGYPSFRSVWLTSTKIHDFLDMSVSKWVGSYNSCFSLFLIKLPSKLIMAGLYIFPFLDSLKDVVSQWGFVFMVASIRIWHRFSSPSWSSLFRVMVATWQSCRVLSSCNHFHP